jgi:HlyD family secretion protein
VLYVPPQNGKQVRPGMDARIQPGGVKKEEWGMLVGRVLAVSEFPSTPQGMLSVLQNDKLVQQFSAKGAPFAVRVELFPDPNAPTGYRWSSGSGPPGALTSGMLADGEITVREQPPIAYVLPFLRKVTGL